jgi:methionine-rich copper-binding protein CopC
MESKFFNPETMKMLNQKKERINMNGFSEALKEMYASQRSTETRVQDIENADIQMRQEVTDLILKIDRRLTIALYAALLANAAILAGVVVYVL